MGCITAPVLGSGSWPAWMARVAKAGLGRLVVIAVGCEVHFQAWMVRRSRAAASGTVRGAVYQPAAAPATALTLLCTEAALGVGARCVASWRPQRSDGSALRARVHGLKRFAFYRAAGVTPERKTALRWSELQSTVRRSSGSGRSVAAHFALLYEGTLLRICRAARFAGLAVATAAGNLPEQYFGGDRRYGTSTGAQVRRPEQAGGPETG